MSGKWINKAQYALYMSSRDSGKTQSISAAKADISERSGRRMEKGEGGPNHRKPRNWRTRKDPLSPVWDEVLVPMLEKNPALMAVTLYEYLQDHYPGQYPNKIRRTLERRVRDWQAKYGPAKEVIFRQVKQPGIMGISDFTEPKDSYAITINGQLLKHILFHFRLPFSGWAGVRVIEGGESFTALCSSLNSIFQQLGGTPKEHRTDSLSAAFKNLNKDTQTDLTDRYHAFCDHYNMKPTRNNRGVSHENGAIESAHGHLKRRISQQLMLRGSNDFINVEAFQVWLDQLVDKYNQRCSARFIEERAALNPLPSQLGVDYDEMLVSVSTQSTIHVARSLYTVPSRLIGENLHIQLHEKVLEIYHNHQHIMTLERVYGETPNQRARNVDFRHVISWLVQKPQAFRNSKLRDDLLPNDCFAAIWQRADKDLDPRMACCFIVKLLYLVKDGQLDEIGEWVLQQPKLPSIEEVRNQFSVVPPSEVSVTSEQHELDEYDALFGGSVL